ncbi:MAG: hypothetical protein KDD37_09480 [Bdellovibrionales bacterium]|nr:hypothetical protein [Bdellovibrionales bacterium]
MIKYLLLLCSLSGVAYAHPVSYEGSYMIGSQNSKSMGRQLVIYSHKYWLGYGLSLDRLEDDRVYASQVSLLAKRWNLPEAQANIYLYGGYGLLEKEDDSTTGIAHYGTQIDYETREVFTAFKYRRFDTYDNYNRDSYVAQAGFAPFVAGFNDLNVWLIGELSYKPEYSRSGEGALLLRFFYKNVYWEMGSSMDGGPIFNFMVHYNP